MLIRRSVVFVLGLIYFNYAKALSEEMQELANTLHNTCVEETGAADNEDEVQQRNDENSYRIGDIANARKGIFADNDNFKCYIKCLMAQMACIDDDGIIDEEATIEILPEEYKAKAEPAIRKCGTIKGKTPCENAWLTHQCYQKSSPDDYFLF